MPIVYGRGRGSGECSIVVATAVAETKARPVETDHGDDQRARNDNLRFARNRNIPQTPLHSHGGSPLPELNRGGFRHDNRKRHSTAGRTVATCNLAHVDLAADAGYLIG